MRAWNRVGALRWLPWAALVAAIAILLSAMVIGDWLLGGGHVPGKVIGAALALYCLPVFGLVGLGASVVALRIPGRPPTLFIACVLNLLLVVVSMVLLAGLS